MQEEDTLCAPSGQKLSFQTILEHSQGAASRPQFSAGIALFARVGPALSLSNIAKVPGGFAPCFAERLRLSGRNLRNIGVFRRVKAQPSRGGKQLIEKWRHRKGAAFPHSERRSHRWYPMARIVIWTSLSQRYPWRAITSNHPRGISTSVPRRSADT